MPRSCAMPSPSCRYDFVGRVPRRRHGEAASEARTTACRSWTTWRRRSTSYEPEAVVDLSDEPVLGPRERFRFASLALAHGVPYVGPDFRFDAPVLEPFELPSIGIVGTGKRVGKTAVASHAARLYRTRPQRARRRDGPGRSRRSRRSPRPARPSIGSSSWRANGRHAASDYLEDAALAGVDTIGCRRAGGGLAGAVVDLERLRRRSAGRRARRRARHLRGQRRRHATRCHGPARPRRRRGDATSSC